MSTQVLSEQEVVRREALNKLRALGIEPFPAAQFPVSHTVVKVKEEFKDAGHVEGAQPEANVVLAGRLMSVRVMGKASFAVLRDASGDQQIYVNRDEIAPGEDKTLYNEVFKKLLHLGDFIGNDLQPFAHDPIILRVGDANALVSMCPILFEPEEKVMARHNENLSALEPSVEFRRCDGQSLDPEPEEKGALRCVKRIVSTTA